MAVSRMLGETKFLVFKGGTALRMCYFDDYRYSADLDFSIVGDRTRVDALRMIGRSLELVKEEIGLPALSLVTDEPTKIAYEGPLGRARSIKLDLDETERVFSSVRRPVVPRYEDVPPSEGLPTYSLVEITAEKLRCVIQRLQCRDFFDLHYLLEVERVKLAETWEMFEEKARHKNIDPAVFFERFDARLPQYEERWAGEMGEPLAWGPSTVWGHEP